MYQSKEILWLMVLAFTFSIFGNTHLVHASVLQSDLNQNAIDDSTEAEVIMTKNATLPAGEYYFDNLIITNNSILTLSGNPDLSENFKGVKINAVNLIVENGAQISGDDSGYISGPGSPITYGEYGASYGGTGGGGASPVPTYGSVLQPTDLGSGTEGQHGGGAVRIIATETLENNGVISADGVRERTSGGSVYVTAKHLRGEGVFRANGGNSGWPYLGKGGGGGRVAIYYTDSVFVGTVLARAGLSCFYGCNPTGEDGTAGLIDTSQNNLNINSSWRFEESESPYNFNKIILRNSAKVTTENNIEVNAESLSLDQESSLVFSDDQVFNIDNIVINGGSNILLSGEETINAENLLLDGDSKISVLPERILNLTIPNITITAGSSISVDGKGYVNGPGTDPDYTAGASYGGVGGGITAKPAYGSDVAPIDFGSGTEGLRGGGAIRLVVNNSLKNDGSISANGEYNRTSGGSVYVTVNNISGSGVFEANGSNGNWPYGSIAGAGGRVAIYYQNSTFTGTTQALGGVYCFYGCNKAAGDGTLVMEQGDQIPVRNPVIIVPGIMGSYLNREDGTEVWMNLLKMILPGNDSYLDELVLSTEGLTINNPALVPSDILRKVLSKDFFDGTIKHLESIGYKEGMDLFVFPYDWRFSIPTIASKLEEKIQEIKTQTRAQKVDIVAHSMGGLVVKQYLKSSDNPSVDKFIDIGTPHAGSPDAFKILNYGDNLNISALDIFGLNSERVKIISQNMPSIYQLLPSQKYFDLYSHYVSDLDDIDGNAVKGRLNYNQTEEFMKNMDRNGLLIDKASQLHQEIDNLNPSDYGVETYNIVGCGTQTLGNIFLLNEETSGGVEYNISYINGDGTVPIKSAEALPASDTYYLKKATHAVMASDSSVKELIGSIISEDENFDISTYPNILTSASDCNIPNGKIVSFHSPIDLHIYDSNGNHAGPDINGDIENNIAGVSYDVIEGNKFAFLPKGDIYKIMGVATDTGTFNARIQTINNEDVVETIYYNKVDISDTTQAQFTVDDLSTTNITLDKEGDDVFETVVVPASVLDGNESVDFIKPTTNINITGNKLSNGSFVSAVRVDLSAEDDNSGVLKIEYSLDGGINWNIYDKPFTINERGGVELMYGSIDRAGNVGINSTIINIINPGNSGRRNI